MASIGEILEEARIRQGRTINEAAQETRISARFIEALELDRFEDLPAPVYAKGFLRSYAAYLQLDPAPLVDAFERFTTDDDTVEAPAAGPAQAVAPAPARPPTQDPFRRTPPPAPSLPVAPAAVATAAAIDEDDLAPDEDKFDDDLDDAELAPAGWTTGGARVIPVASAPGVLTSRGRGNGDNRGGLWLLALAGGAAFIALAVFAVVALANRGGGDDNNSAAPPPSSTATIAAALSATATPPSATATAGESPTSTPTNEPTATPTIVDRTGNTPTPVTAGQTRPTPTRTTSSVIGGDTQEPTSTPTARPTSTPTRVPTATPTVPPPTPTPTLPPPTPTPIPPTPTPTQVSIATPSMYALCAQNDNSINCGDTAFYTVVCAPAGPFVDPRGEWVGTAQQYGWVVTQAAQATRAAISAACG